MDYVNKSHGMDGLHLHLNLLQIGTTLIRSVDYQIMTMNMMNGTSILVFVKAYAVAASVSSVFIGHQLGDR